AADERRGGEERDPLQEEPPVAEVIAEPPAEQQEAAVGEHVGVHDPDERGLREAQAFPDRRQGDVHDRRVEHDHQLAGAKDVEREPAGSLAHLLASSIGALKNALVIETIQSGRSIGAKWLAPGSTASWACWCRRNIWTACSGRTMSASPIMIR